ncbi:AMP-binding protein [Sphingomonas sp. ID0503]|uniref:AMP-binding protein n=1 Tax=Sphingomonas sp. ID0503 TaxID=3399691 RepID=UPI003AFAF87E
MGWTDRLPLDGLMMGEQLLLSRLIDYAADYHGKTEVVARELDGTVARSDWASVRRGAARMANGLRAAGFDGECRVASLEWSTLAHLQHYYAVLGLGLPLHTLNPRLTPDDLAYMVRLVGDDVVIFDTENAALAASLAPLVPEVAAWISVGDIADELVAAFPRLIRESDLLAGAADAVIWPEFDENRAATICFTSGTTGRPKGVAYTHRSITLSAMNMSMADMYANTRGGEAECVLPIAAMFHANAWMMPFSAALNGQKLVLPGRRLDAGPIVDLIVDEAVTLAGGVPTIWTGVLDELDRRGITSTPLRTALVAGTALPGHIFDRLTERGVVARQSWGMTEVPGAARGAPPLGASRQTPEQQRKLAVERQGRVAAQARARLVDGEGQPLPFDGVAAGDLELRGPTVLSRYVGEPPEAAREWLATGDIAVIHPDATLAIVDRAKDVIKSGGEWISSPQLEAAAVSHPAIAAAAAIAMPHPRWQERPLLVCVAEAGLTVSDEELRTHMEAAVARWWLPEMIVYRADLPLTPTGKINKAALRAEYIEAEGSKR